MLQVLGDPDSGCVRSSTHRRIVFEVITFVVTVSASRPLSVAIRFFKRHSRDLPHSLPESCALTKSRHEM